MKKILSVFGTRPEVIKMAPVIKALKSDKSFDAPVLSLGQHRELLDQMVSVFKIDVDVDLNIMKPNQSLTQLTSDLLIPIERTLLEIKPDLVLAQGDTTSTFVMGLACAYAKIPFGHIEAGLRTYNYLHPFPEEMNRVLVSRLSTIHYAPTELAKQNLIREGINPNSILVTGNTVIDALFEILSKNPLPYPDIDPSKRLVLITLHRRENWYKLPEILKALIQLSRDFSDIQFLIPVHPNPNVRHTIHSTLGKLKAFHLSEPLDYITFIATLKKATLAISDSGGIQEEAPSLKVPVLVAREFTERTEAIDAGVAKLVGTDYEPIYKAAHELLSDEKKRQAMIKEVSPFGDGHAAERIVNNLKS